MKSILLAESHQSFDRLKRVASAKRIMRVTEEEGADVCAFFSGFEESCFVRFDHFSRELINAIGGHEDAFDPANISKKKIWMQVEVVVTLLSPQNQK